ncbi:hypothetical protein BH10PSE12_BH10PSE12_23280 [soil metagenome]
MLSKFDDYPIHQTSEPLAHAATSERNFYDRTWFNGFEKDGNYYFGVGMAVYPHRGILDCHFSVIAKGGKQYCFYGSRRAPQERSEMEVGPFRIEILDPLKSSRVVLEENESGITCDLVFTSRTGAIEESHQTMWNGVRKMMDATRFDVFGRWSGWIETPEGRIEVNEDACHGIKDRSWGHRQIGEPETGGAPPPPNSRSFVVGFAIWAPQVWDDHVSHVIYFDGEEGQPIYREALNAPIYESSAAAPRVELELDKLVNAAGHRETYVPGTRHIASAEFDMIDWKGNVRTVKVEPILRFQMKGLGYFHPKWGQGMWQGELALGHEVIDPETLDPLDPASLHTQHVVKATDGTRTGVGIYEHFVFGPYHPTGFMEMLDGAKP